jgi:hypothetical protein
VDLSGSGEGPLRVPRGVAGVPRGPLSYQPCRELVARAPLVPRQRERARARPVDDGLVILERGLHLGRGRPAE